VLTDESKPATRRLAELLRALRPLVRDARPTIRDLRTLIRAPGPGNDLIELNQKAPKLQSLSSKDFPRTIDALQKSQPVIEYVRPYSPDLTGWFTKFGQGAANYDANGHYARVQPIFNAFQLTQTPAGEVLTAVRPNQRLEGFEFGKQQRCPGAAIQPAPDGSNPWFGSGTDGNFTCDPSIVLPGP
jgi:phospholipid/cholesterol/gamma-HCH transport system substrate-binding protein